MIDTSAYIDTYIEHVIRELKRIRKQSGLTQEEVAERMHTKQEVISRLEKDMRGSFSLKRIADYALACGYIPLNLMDVRELHCIPIEDARQMYIETQESISWQKYIRWKAQKILDDL